MDKKAQTSVQIGMIITIFITVLVGVILLQAVAQETNEPLNTAALINATIPGTVSNTTILYVEYRSLADVVIHNGTENVGNTVAAANYTVTNNVINPTNGALSVSITPATVGHDFNGEVWWITSATAQRQGYIAGSGGRAVAGLIVLFFALAIAIVAMTPVLRSGIIDSFGK